MRQPRWSRRYVAAMWALLAAGRLCGNVVTVGLDPAAQFATIQAAIDAASDGDTVLVADGTYRGAGNRDIDFQGKDVIVRSANGPDRCLIDCEGQARGFLFHNGETVASVLDGFTIMAGRADRGGGICCTEMSSPTILRCILRENEASHGGGGMYISAGSPVLTGCIFTGNSSRDDGGALYNRATNHVSVTACHFTGNLARDNGGAMFNRYGASPELLHCVFSENIARSTGAAIYNRDRSDPCLTNCLFFQNRADDSGGAICNRNRSSPTLINCTIADNQATFECGGIVNWDDCRPVLRNCILWGNTDLNGTGGPSQVHGGGPSITSCCIQGYGGAGNTIGQAPQFVAGPMGDYYLSQVAAGQAGTSPCCDAGVAPPDGMDPAGFTTRTDHVQDSGPVDLGYHYPIDLPHDPGTSAEAGAAPPEWIAGLEASRFRPVSVVEIEWGGSGL